MLSDDLGSGEEGQVVGLSTPAPLPHLCDDGNLPAGLKPSDLAVKPRQNRRSRRGRREQRADQLGLTVAQMQAHEDYGG